MRVWRGAHSRIYYVFAVAGLGFMCAHRIYTQVCVRVWGLLRVHRSTNERCRCWFAVSFEISIDYGDFLSSDFYRFFVEIQWFWFFPFWSLAINHTQRNQLDECVVYFISAFVERPPRLSRDRCKSVIVDGLQISIWNPLLLYASEKLNWLIFEIYIYSLVAQLKNSKIPIYVSIPMCVSL